MLFDQKYPVHREAGFSNVDIQTYTVARTLQLIDWISPVGRFSEKLRMLNHDFWLKTVFLKLPNKEKLWWQGQDQGQRLPWRRPPKQQQRYHKDNTKCQIYIFFKCQIFVCVLKCPDMLKCCVNSCTKHTVNTNVTDLNLRQGWGWKCCLGSNSRNKIKLKEST